MEETRIPDGKRGNTYRKRNRGMERIANGRDGERTLKREREKINMSMFPHQREVLKIRIY